MAVEAIDLVFDRIFTRHQVLYEQIVRDHPPLLRGRVFCARCGRPREIDAANCLRDGWPRCAESVGCATRAELKS